MFEEKEEKETSTAPMQLTGDETEKTETKNSSFLDYFTERWLHPGDYGISFLRSYFCGFSNELYENKERSDELHAFLEKMVKRLSPIIMPKDTTAYVVKSEGIGKNRRIWCDVLSDRGRGMGLREVSAADLYTMWLSSAYYYDRMCETEDLKVWPPETMPNRVVDEAVLHMLQQRIYTNTVIHWLSRCDPVRRPDEDIAVQYTKIIADACTAYGQRPAPKQPCITYSCHIDQGSVKRTNTTVEFAIRYTTHKEEELVQPEIENERARENSHAVAKFRPTVYRAQLQVVYGGINAVVDEDQYDRFSIINTVVVPYDASRLLRAALQYEEHKE